MAGRTGFWFQKEVGMTRMIQEIEGADSRHHSYFGAAVADLVVSTSVVVMAAAAEQVGIGN